MEYLPELTPEKVKEVYDHFKEKLILYKSKGMDFNEYQKFLLNKIETLQEEILEIGTGNGYTAVSLAKGGYNFTSIDISEEALKTTAARLAYDKVLSKVKLHIMDAANLEFGDGKIKSIIVVNVLHHVEDMGKLLSEADRVLSPKGKIVISDFNEEGQKRIDAVHREQGGSHEHPIADKNKIGLFFQQRGYKITSFENMGHWLLICQK